MTKRLITDIKLITPYIIHKEILQIQKDKSREGLTYQCDREVPINEIMIKKFKRFNNNYKVLIDKLFLNLIPNNESTAIVHHDFNNKQKIQRTYFSNILKIGFEINIFVKNGIFEETSNISYEDISSIKREFSHFLMMRNYNEEGPNIFNVLLHSTIIFSITFSVIHIKFYQKNTISVQKILTTKYILKVKEKKKIENIFVYIFVMFFMNSYEIFYENTSTLSIMNSNEFGDIKQYQNITKFIIISENIYEIPSDAFSGWHSVVSVNFGNSVTNIGGSVFSLCSQLETIIIGENVTTIGGSSFSLCSSIKNITIPNSVTTIGGSAFSLCSNLTLLTLGYGIREIGSSAFGNCYNLECIYYYGYSEPEIRENAFFNVSTSVITYPTYKGSKFGNLDVAKENAEGTCNPIPTHSFSQSNTFTESLQSDISLSFSYTLTITLSITHSLTIYETKTKTFSLYINNSTFSYIETEFIYYNYTIVIYSTYYNYYSNFFTMFYTSNENSPNGITTNALIGIICGSFAFVLVIVGIVIFLVKSNNKKEKSDSKLQFKDTTTSSTKQIEEVNSLVEDIVKEDEDNWL